MSDAGAFQIPRQRAFDWRAITFRDVVELTGADAQPWMTSDNLNRRQPDLRPLVVIRVDAATIEKLSQEYGAGESARNQDHDQKRYDFDTRQATNFCEAEYCNRCDGYGTDGGASRP